MRQNGAPRPPVVCGRFSEPVTEPARRCGIRSPGTDSRGGRHRGRHLIGLRLAGPTPSRRGGKVDAPLAKRVFWASLESLVAIALLLGGGLSALRTASVATGLPFAIVLLLGSFALVKGLLAEPDPRRAAS
jgi:hypothetical protein